MDERQQSNDYLAPPPASEPTAEMRRTHTILALLCALSLPLCGCSMLYADDQGTGGAMIGLIHLGLIALTFGVPLFALGHSKGRAVQPSLALWMSGLFIGCVIFLMWRMFGK